MLTQPVPEVAMKLSNKTGENAGRNPSVASRRRATRERGAAHRRSYATEPPIDIM